MVAVSFLAFLAIRSIGERLTAPTGSGTPLLPVVEQDANALFPVLLALVAIVVTARVVGFLFGLMGQPAVMGEVIGGIVLGPSLLGRVAPDIFAQLLPVSATAFLGTYAQVGVILYLFLVGLEFDLERALRTDGTATLVISHASIFLPFIMGSGSALFLYPLLSASNVSFTIFALFLGVSMSVTAFPVLARILTDHGMNKSRMGRLALACAAIDDVTAWCLLAVVVSFARVRAVESIHTAILTFAFVVFMFTVLAPIVRRLIRGFERSAELTPGALRTVLVAALVSAMVTEHIGIHAFFGAFLFGAIIPNGSRVAQELNNKLHDFVAVLLLPAFFAHIGMRTEIGLLSGLGNWLLCAGVILVACLGKFGGTLVASRLCGLGWTDSAVLGILMNTRGLVELVVLNLGLDLGIISPKLFTMLVIMALTTTLATTPVLRFLLRNQLQVTAIPRGPRRS